MNSRGKIILCGALGVFLAGPAFAGTAQYMMAADKAFCDMPIAKGPHAAFLAYMAEDARLYEGDHPPIIGGADKKAE